jgi:hypothetical protein
MEVGEIMSEIYKWKYVYNNRAPMLNRLLIGVTSETYKKHNTRMKSCQISINSKKVHISYDAILETFVISDQNYFISSPIIIKSCTKLCKNSNSKFSLNSIKRYKIPIKTVLRQ